MDSFLEQIILDKLLSLIFSSLDMKMGILGTLFRLAMRATLAQSCAHSTC